MSVMTISFISIFLCSIVKECVFSAEGTQMKMRISWSNLWKIKSKTFVSKILLALLILAISLCNSEHKESKCSPTLWHNLDKIWFAVISAEPPDH